MTLRLESPTFPTVDDHIHTLTVSECVSGGEGIVSITLTSEDNVDLPSWTPGSHIDVILDDSDPENPLIRQYSLWGDPEDRSRYQISVLLSPESRGGSKWVHENLKPGTSLAIRGPRNHFPFEDANEYIFLAGGIGITPLLPMAREAERRGAPWRLYQLCQNEQRLALASIVEELPPEKIERRYSDIEGFVDFKALTESLAPGTHVYACGPTGMLDILEKLATDDAQWTFHCERFAADPIDTTGDTEFEVILDSTDEVVTVPAGVSCLQALRDHGLNLEWSCREGVCGTCETEIIEGEPIHRDSVLTDEERQSGETMMICVSRAKTPRLRLDL